MGLWEAFFDWLRRLKEFQAFMERQQTTAPSSTVQESSLATSTATSNRRPTEAEKLAKLKDLLLDLENENRNHVSRIARITEEITQQIRSLEVNDDD